ncbi:MAG: sigma-70 family RNA polymerase sigma factor, partial [Clostridia bacterium]|nr:sigma-70 family RNA polymerase sigma factor [Clostridia bacterium]
LSTSEIPVLSEKEKTDLLLKMKKGDPAAREQMITGNLRLVLSVLQRFMRRTDSPDDLFQVGCVGLIKAVDHFDVEQNVKFSTYAVPMIIGEIRRYLRDNNMIRVSRSVRDLAYKALSERDRLIALLDREPTAEEVTRALKDKYRDEIRSGAISPFTEKDVTDAMDAVMDPVSLFDPVYSEGGDNIYLMDQICDQKGGSEHWIINIALEEAFDTLGDREKKILNMRFYQGKTQMEVADAVGISQAQVSRLEKGALGRIRKEIL